MSDLLLCHLICGDWGMSNCNWPNMSLWDESKCFSSSKALHMSGLDPRLEEWRLLRVTFLRKSQNNTWTPRDNQVIIDQFYAREPNDLLVEYHEHFCKLCLLGENGKIWRWYIYTVYTVYSVVAGVAKVQQLTVKYRFEKKSYSEFIYGKLQSVLFFWSSQRWFEGIEKLIDQSWWKCQCGNHFQVCNFNHGDFCRRSNHGNVQDKEWHNQF